jgi:hypothetical protein
VKFDPLKEYGRIFLLTGEETDLFERMRQDAAETLPVSTVFHIFKEPLRQSYAWYYGPSLSKVPVGALFVKAMKI